MRSDKNPVKNVSSAVLFSFSRFLHEFLTVSAHFWTGRTKKTRSFQKSFFLVFSTSAFRQISNFALPNFLNMRGFCLCDYRARRWTSRPWILFIAPWGLWCRGLRNFHVRLSVVCLLFVCCCHAQN